MAPPKEECKECKTTKEEVKDSVKKKKNKFDIDDDVYELSAP